MDKKVFEKLQNHVFDKGNTWDIWEDKSQKEPNRLPYFSTWAIWNDSNIKDLSLINLENADCLKPNIVFVALNFSYKLPKNWAYWQNIHNVNRLYELLHGTRFEGAYITDIVKDYPFSKSEKVQEEIENNKDRRDRNIRWFFEEMNLLGANSIEIYLFGKIAEDIFKEYVMQHEQFSEFSKKLRKCQRIDHYGQRNKFFERNAPTQLGLASNNEATIHQPLWSCDTR